MLLSAVAHATWNYLAKVVRGGAAFLWLFDAVAVIVYGPIAAIAVASGGGRVGSIGLAFMAGSAALHTAYFLLLQRAYRTADLSLVYPLARGTGPMLSTALAIAILGERPTPLAVAGGLLVVGGAMSITGSVRRLRAAGSLSAVIFAVSTGAVIAVYTVWDTHAVSGLSLNPIVYDWGGTVARLVLLSPWAVNRGELAASWRAYRREAVWVGLLSPLAYILVLTALVFTPVSYVAPAREIGVLFGALMGAKWLGEADATRRVAAAAVMVVGIVLLAVP